MSLTSSSRIPFVIALTLTITLTHARRSPYVTIASGTCESNGFRSIYTGYECASAARRMKYTWEDEYLAADYADVVDGCSIRGFWGEGFSLFATVKGSCKVGNEAPDWIPELNRVATCKCTRFGPCICKKRGIRSRCPSGKLETIPVRDGNGNISGSKKVCVPKRKD